MQTYRIGLRLPSSFITPWQADTIFGHLCWAAERHDGFQNFSGAAGLIELYRSEAEAPPLILSDGMPGDFLPAPAHLKNLFERGAASPPSANSYSLLKKVKGLEFLTLDQFNACRQGESFTLPEETVRPISTSVTLHNQISRVSNTTGSEGGGLFELEERFLAEGRLSIYARIAPGFEDDTRRLFESFAAGGYGRKRTTGKGAFAIETFAPFAGFDTIPEDRANGVVVLSHFVPARTDPTEGAYRIMVKYGRLGEEKTFCGNPFKRPLVMLRPGAAFRTRSPMAWCGRLVDKVAYADDHVVQYGFGFTLPMIWS